MIPKRFILEWTTFVPWQEPRQIEQYLMNDTIILDKRTLSFFLGWSLNDKVLSANGFVCCCVDKILCLIKFVRTVCCKQCKSALIVYNVCDSNQSVTDNGGKDDSQHICQSFIPVTMLVQHLSCLIDMVLSGTVRDGLIKYQSTRDRAFYRQYHSKVCRCGD